MSSSVSPYKIGDSIRSYIKHTKLHRTLATIILDIVYGLQVESMDDEYIKLVVQSMDAFSESRVTGRYWVDFMPFLKYIPPWVPGAVAVKYGAQWLPKVREMVNRPFDSIKQQLNEKVCGLSQDSLVHQFTKLHLF